MVMNHDGHHPDNSPYGQYHTTATNRGQTQDHSTLEHIPFLTGLRRVSEGVNDVSCVRLILLF